LKTSPDENGYKPLSIIAENVLEIPDNCSLDEFDPHYACSCGIEEPTIWYDEPMEKWRMLFVQYPSRQINGQCIPDLKRTIHMLEVMLKAQVNPHRVPGCITTFSLHILQI